MDEMIELGAYGQDDEGMKWLLLLVCHLCFRFDAAFPLLCMIFFFIETTCMCAGLCLWMWVWACSIFRARYTVVWGVFTKLISTHIFLYSLSQYMPELNIVTVQQMTKEPENLLW